jgi:uncharacterized protein involved in response to NO
MPLNSSVSPSKESPSEARRDILGLLAAIFYGLFTLLPDNSSVLVSWPWVFVWQVALILPWLWLLRQWWVQTHFVRLGYGLDYGMGLAMVGVVASTVFAPFPHQARWYGWAALCCIAAVYALNEWCANRDRRLLLLRVQGALSFVFILESLVLWASQTLFPELTRLQGLRAAGLNVSFDFSVLELRNWAPIGHQNYVAGFLVLSLPLLLGFALISQGSWRQVWGLGFGLGLVDLYTTSSRGGWLGLALMGASGILLLMGHRSIPRRLRWGGGLLLLLGLGGIALANNRLRSIFTTTFDSAGGETAFRLITNTAGWKMGLAYPVFGVGPGGVSLLYQSYRPGWAGREAELVYQLHSTPAQIWAEFGGWGMVLSLGLLVWLGYWGVRLWRTLGAERSSLAMEGDRILCWSLLAGLAGYGVISVTDYQLDIVCISGTLIIYGVSLLSLLRDCIPSGAVPAPMKSFQRLGLCWGMVGLLIAVGIWLAPIYRAWQLSSLGFSALDRRQPDAFVNKLDESHRLAAWEPYYSTQLGWNLSNFAFQSANAKTSRDLMGKALNAMQQSVKASPNQEFNHSSVGWLQMFAQQPGPATQSFAEATRLMPAKRGTFHSLGLSLLQTQKVDAAIQSFALEILRDPLWLTSPVWRSAQLAPLYPKVKATVIETYQKLLSARPLSSRTWEIYLHQCLGGVYWWQGDLSQAAKEWNANGSVLSKTVLAIAQHEGALTQGRLEPIANPTTAGEFMVKAWLDPQTRSALVAQALLRANQAQPDAKQIQPILAGMARSKSFDEWVKSHAPINQYRRERAGFGVLSRHIDGPAPRDFFPVVDNTAMTQFLAELLPSPVYSPELDTALQLMREQVWRSIASVPTKTQG